MRTQANETEEKKEKQKNRVEPSVECPLSAEQTDTIFSTHRI